MDRFVTVLVAVYLVGVLAAGMQHGVSMNERGWPIRQIVTPSLVHGLGWPAELADSVERWLGV
jgi:hypothetical protein